MAIPTPVSNTVSDQVNANVTTDIAGLAVVEPAHQDLVTTKKKQTADVEGVPEGRQAATVNTDAITKTSSSAGPTTAASVAKDTTGAGSLYFGVEEMSSALEIRILKGLEYSNADQGLHNISKIPHSAVWGLGGNKNYVIEYGTQIRVTAWVIGRLDFKAITNNGNLLSISIKPFRTTDADVSNLLTRRLSQAQLRADEACYANIRASYYKSQYGASISASFKTFDDMLRDATEVYDKMRMPTIPLESFKLGDIVMAEKNGDFGLSYDLQVLALLKACCMKELKDFVAVKEILASAAVAQTAGAVL
ncbi:hypothetical protein M407DRAFT_33782 [Tulasnella calospora MUT 4182]|uniref:Uncharacterized protein n=1 Tax=Tulasnella calospora MUT 4182 TaxID=1051891 RepID=A0A0C3K5A9_9AGAM|nr:hypothetical protein M407DRAFT_33782 [Tulasnella calospora MUT 4182]